MLINQKFLRLSKVHGSCIKLWCTCRRLHPTSSLGDRSQNERSRNPWKRVESQIGPRSPQLESHYLRHLSGSRKESTRSRKQRIRTQTYRSHLVARFWPFTSLWWHNPGLQVNWPSARCMNGAAAHMCGEKRKKTNSACVRLLLLGGALTRSLAGYNRADPCKFTSYLQRVRLYCLGLCAEPL